MDTLILILATVIVGLVAVQLGAATYDAVSGLGGQRERRKLTNELFRERVEAVKALRAQRVQSALAWNGYRKFVVDRKVSEAVGICSFYLAPHDNKPLPGFKPGQFLTFRLALPGHEKPVIRCYSLSDSPRSDYYRVTIKRVPADPKVDGAAPGLVSNYFHDHIHEGEILDVKAPGGHFVLDPYKRRPAVLIAGGVGITPMVSMLGTIAALKTEREVWLFYGVRHGREHAFKEYLQTLSSENRNIRNVVCYSRATEDDVEGLDYHHAGHVTVDLLKQYIGTSNYPFFLCGPPPMMKSLTKQLSGWGVSKNDVYTEAFGPASVKAKVAAAKPDSADRATCTLTVTFARTGKRCPWTPIAGNLLEFAEQNGAVIDAGCRAGNCGTCEVAVKSGQVEYNQEPEYPDLKAGCCLPCIGVPKGDVILDA